MASSPPVSAPARGLRSLPRPVWVLAAGLFVNAFGNFLPIFLVLYLTSRGASAAAAGLALTGYGAGRITAPLLGGLLADRLARRTVITLGMSISAVAVAALPLLPGLVAPGPLAVLTGLGTALGTPAAAARTAAAGHRWPEDQQERGTLGLCATIPARPRPCSAAPEPTPRQARKAGGPGLRPRLLVRVFPGSDERQHGR